MSSARQNRLMYMAITFATVDDYIMSFPLAVQDVLDQIRRTMHAAAPGADEMISYNIPTLTLDGHPVVHFAGWARHVSVYRFRMATTTTRASSRSTGRGRRRGGSCSESQFRST